MAFWGLLGKKSKGSSTIATIVIGEDKNLMHRDIESSGDSFRDPKNLLAYDSIPECIGKAIHVAKGHRKYVGLTALLYETMARPYSFKKLGWVEIQHKKDQIKASALSEGCSKAVQRIDLEDRFNKMWTLALIAVAGVIGLALLFAFSSGLFSKIIGR
jgi:hypothetical protein